MEKKTDLKIVDNSAELEKKRAEKEADRIAQEESLKIAQEQFKKEAEGIQQTTVEPLLRWFQSDGMQEPFATVVGAYGNLARAIVKFMKPSAERTVALRRLLESKDAAIRAIFESAERG